MLNKYLLLIGCGWK